MTASTHNKLKRIDSDPGVAIVIGASGQDGYFLTESLLGEGWHVHAIARHPEQVRTLANSPDSSKRLRVAAIDIEKPAALLDLIAQTKPDEIYNLAGQSSVSKSFSDPSYTWRTNAEVVAQLLECIRLKSPKTRFYQASTTDMFGDGGGSTAVFCERSPLNPLSPYAAAKTAAHILCQTYRTAYGLKIACGILANHESHRRRSPFLSRKIVDHVQRLRSAEGSDIASIPPLMVGNLKTCRDWGFAPDYVEGIRLILRQIKVRSLIRGGQPFTDKGSCYRDYVLGTGNVHAVWQIVDTAFQLGGFDLEWNLAGQDPAGWGARFRSTHVPAVAVDTDLLRPADPLVIKVDPSKAKAELGWSARAGLEVFLRDMLLNRIEKADNRSSFESNA